MSRFLNHVIVRFVVVVILMASAVFDPTLLSVGLAAFFGGLFIGSVIYA